MVEPIIKFDEVLRDSPYFRQTLLSTEQNVSDLEDKIDHIVKSCVHMVEQGRQYNHSIKQFFDVLEELSNHFQGDNQIQNWINDCIKVGRNLIEFGSILVDHSEKSFARSLNSFIKNDVRKLKESHSAFSKISSDLDTSLQRHAQLPKTKGAEIEETGKLLMANRTCFQHTALEYVGQISKVQTMKKHVLMEALLSQMQALRTFHSQALKTFGENEYVLDEASQFAAESRAGYDKQCMLLFKDVENHLHQVSGEAHCPVSTAEGNLEGYLFKRTKNAFKTWNRRWFVLDNGQLSYRKRDVKEVTVVEHDLRLCTVKKLSDGERRFCFEVVSPHKSHILQADSENAQNIWVEALKQAINNAHNQNENHVNKQQLCAAVLAPGNERCADCNRPKPEWASVNIGATLCIECSGIHRSLGVHISKVRSLKLDSWEDEIVRIMEKLGNASVNNVFAFNGGDESLQACPDSDRPTRENWIQAKYVDKKFIKPLPNEEDRQRFTGWTVTLENASFPNKGIEKSKIYAFGDYTDSDETVTNSRLPEPKELRVHKFSELNASRLLYEAASVNNLNVMLHALALGADPNYHCETDQLRTPLHKAILSGPWISATEFLLLNGAQHTAVDADGRTALHLASQLSSVSLVGLLLKKGADRDAVDSQGNSALALAVANGNAEVVTLIRLDKFREDLRLEDSDFTGGDDVFDQVVRDFNKQATTKSDSGA